MVCLHCRHAGRLAARAARGRMFSHVMLGGAILGVIAVVVSAATAAFDGRQEAGAATAPTAATTSHASLEAPAAPATAAPVMVKEVAAESAPLVIPAIIVSQPAAPSPTSPIAQPTSPIPPSIASPSALPGMPLIPLVPEGTSPLSDSMSVVRQGDTMLVHFDTELARTRRPEKFDAVVRATLVQIYGPAAETLLSGIAPGTLARGGDLLAELPTRGIRLPAGDGRTLSLWPVTRPGRDGPLVVSYRATVTP